MVEIQKSGDKTSSGEIGLDIRTHASPKVRQEQVSRGISVLCWHDAPVLKTISKAPYQVQYAKIGKVTKLYLIASFNDLDWLHFVLKCSCYLSFIILNLYTKQTVALTKILYDIPHDKSNNNDNNIILYFKR